MGKPNLVVIGGGEDQLPAYLEGHRLGYRVIGFDQKPEALGAALADEFHPVTIRDPEAIAAALGPVDVAAFISLASDTALPAIAALRRRYGTAAQLSPAAVRASVDKGYFRGVVRRLGLPAYRHAEGRHQAELAAAAESMRYPLVVKPVDGSGSKGLTLVRRPGEVGSSFEYARRHSFDGRVCVEEAVDGRHGSVECLLVGGGIEFMAVTERTLTPPPHMITVTHRVPADLPPRTTDTLATALTGVCAELDHRDGPVNLDFVLAPDGTVYLIEFAARCGGAGLPLLIRHAYGVDNVGAAIRQAAGLPFDVAPARTRPVLSHVLHAPHDGVLTRLGDIGAVAERPEVVDLRLFAGLGDPVSAYTQAAHKLGYLVVAGTAGHDVERAAARALADLDIGVTPHDDVRRFDR
jgi:biotin carboxylase